MESALTPERWRRARAVFDRVSALPAGERAAAIAADCADDPALAGEVRALLAADDAAGSDFLAGNAFAHAPATAVEEPPRQQIGPYAVIRELGRGGMGTVYLARRRDGDFTHDVAVKVVRAGIDSELLRRRFRAERRMLAALQHPGIARLYDGGTTEDGLPYFVMEHVVGESLLEFCDRRALPAAARLRLFVEICAAVQHAHRHLIVHRDLKPGNILVTADGAPKLLDFGVAKWLEPEVEPALDATAHGIVLMTPSYASPEQVRGEPVTTASDVYALGVILYELLTGRRPYVLRSERQDELERAILEQQPERPSTAARQLDASRDDADPAQPLGRAALPWRQLRGDLDAIVLTAIRKEPERRYPSAESLGADVERHLEGMPVSARLDTWGYRGRKFVARHRIGVVLSSAAALIIGGLIVFYTARLARERDRARLESEKARQVSGFLTSLFELSDLDRTRGVKLGVRDLVDRGAGRVAEELRDQPELQAAIERVIGGVYAELDLKQQARPLFEHALATRRALYGENHSEVAASERELAILLHALGDEQGAERLLRQALKTEEATAGDGVLEAARTLTMLGNVHKNTAQYAEAGREFARAAAIEEAAGETAELDLAKTLSNWGLEQLSSGQSGGAVPLFKRALAIQERRLGDQTPAVGAALLNLGAALRETGDVDAAIAHDERAIALIERAYGRGHGDYAHALNELASAWRAKGDLAKARDLYLQAIPICESVFGADHQTTLSQRRNLAIVLVQTGDLRGALAEFTRTLAGRERAYGADHPRVAESLFDVAKVRLELGGAYGARDAEAEMRRALAIYRRKLPADSLQLASGLDDLGELLCSQHRPAEGSPLLTESVGILRAVLPPTDPDLQATAAAAEHCKPTSPSR